MNPTFSFSDHTPLPIPHSLPLFSFSTHTLSIHSLPSLLLTVSICCPMIGSFLLPRPRPLLGFWLYCHSYVLFLFTKLYYYKQYCAVCSKNAKMILYLKLINKYISLLKFSTGIIFYLAFCSFIN